MASSPSSSSIPPSSSSPSPPSPSSSSSSLTPPPSASLPNATSEPPTSSSAPPTTSNSPPPSPSLPNSPPPSVNLPPPSTPPPTSSSPPPSSAPPPSPPSNPPPQADPPAVSPPPPTLPTLPPQVSPPPPSPSPPITAPPPSTPPPKSSPPSPPAATPPSALSPPASTPPPASSPPPPSSDPPVPSPPSPVSRAPSPSRSNPPPSNPSNPPPPKESPPSNPSNPPPPKESPPSNPSNPPPPKESPPSDPPTPSPPSNSTGAAPPSDPTVPSPPLPGSPPSLPSPNTPSGNPTSPISPTGNKSSTFGPNDTAGTGGGSGGGGHGRGNSGVIVPVAVVTSLLVLSFVGLALWYFGKRKRKSGGGYSAGFVMPSPVASSQMSESSYPHTPTAPLVYSSSGGIGSVNSPDPGLGNSKSWFSYEELYKVTDGFSNQNLLGEGGFGCVYKGVLADGREVAVKQLKVGGSQGEREFRAEVEIIGRVHHRHLVSLVGYCFADSHRLLVYDYVPNNTLHYHIHVEGGTVLDWQTRVKIAAGAARGIAYLHEDCHPRIIHRDIKSSNILLDSNFEAQVADFGLARLAMDAVTHVTTRVMGTFGYLAPEYASSGKLTERSDVYSYGVVLLELITGKKPVDSSQPLGDESLVEWARPLLAHALESGEFDGLPDPRLEKNYNEHEMLRMIEAAAACVRHSAAMRPRMGLVVRALDGLADVDLNNGVRPGQSELFTPHSSEIRMFQRMAFGSQEYSSDFSNFSRASRRSHTDL